MSQIIIPVKTFDYFVFGATGDLAKKKLFLALYYRFADGQIPAEARIIGCARTELNHDSFKAMITLALEEAILPSKLKNETMAGFLKLLFYQKFDVYQEPDWQGLVDVVNQTDDERITVFYLSVAPSLFEPIVKGLKKHNLNSNSRLVVEKPLGSDLRSALKLNQLLRDAFDESRLYRIDHYLGKETVQNLMALRFANAMFEPLWNSHYIDHVQITAAETLGVAGRGGYYDNAGAMRDMVQNHLLQLLCLSAMEPPAAFDADSVRDEKLKVLRCLKPLNGQVALDSSATGQYQAASENPSYLDDAEVKNSNTESYAALCVNVDNWRWSGTPFYLRTGKRLSHKMIEITFVFRKAPHFIFDHVEGPTEPNALVIRLQPDEGIDIEITTKQPGHGGMRFHQTSLETAESTNELSPDAYQRLLLDVVRGDQTLFMRGDEVEAAWAWVDPIIEAWQTANVQPDAYEAGSDGPKSAEELIKRGGHQWRKIH